MRSSLANFAATGREPDPAAARRAAGAAWHEHGIALFNPAWFTSWADQKQVEILAEKIFGKRTARAVQMPITRRGNEDVR